MKWEHTWRTEFPDVISKGKEGWELVNVVNEHISEKVQKKSGLKDTGFIYFMKRPVGNFVQMYNVNLEESDD